MCYPKIVFITSKTGYKENYVKNRRFLIGSTKLPKNMTVENSVEKNLHFNDIHC